MVDYERVLNGGTVRLVDIIDEHNRISGLEATDVTISGPGILALNPPDLWFEDCIWTFGAAGFDSLLWDIDPARRGLTGAILLESSSFVRCTFRYVGVAAVPDVMASFVENQRIF